ncbi:hypothetical protein AAVH_17512 [Aphelenchoides avenae]|nr:hypothetical protein AAVH_17512 [Aphelenchus avenae]
MRNGGVQLLQFFSVNFIALGDDALLDAVGWRGLKLLVVERCIVPSRLVTDGLLRAAQGLRRLRIRKNESDTPHMLSDDAVKDFFFLESAPSPGQWPDLEFEGTGLTDMFLAKVFEVSTR